MTARSIVVGAILVVAVAVVTGYVLLAYFGSKETAQQLEAIKTAATVVLGAGGSVALLLAARRQRSAELTLKENARIAAENAVDRARDLALREKAAEDARLDAAERRITDLYTKAADQLGNVNASVRLAGLYSMERLANDNPSQQQTIVNVLCAYLRTPYELMSNPGDDADAEARSQYQMGEQERQVRRAAQEIIGRGLTTAHGNTRWPGINLNLAGAYLEDFSLTGTSVENADFKGASFLGSTSIEEAEFVGTLTLQQAKFIGQVTFHNVTFRGVAVFSDDEFHGITQITSCLFDCGLIIANATCMQNVHICRIGTPVDGPGGLPFAILSRSRFREVLNIEECQFDTFEFNRCSAALLQISNTDFTGGVSFIDVDLPAVRIYGPTISLRTPDVEQNLPGGIKYRDIGSDRVELTAGYGD